MKELILLILYYGQVIIWFYLGYRFRKTISRYNHMIAKHGEHVARDKQRYIVQMICAALIPIIIQIILMVCQ